jgi:hypothetical protein
VLITVKCLVGLALRFVHITINGPAQLVTCAQLAVLQVIAEESRLDEVLLSLAAEPMILSHALRRLQDVETARRTGRPPGLSR